MKGFCLSRGGGQALGDSGKRLLQPVSVLGQVLDLSGFAKVTSLVVLPFAHEDLAIVLGGYLIVNEVMPAALVVLSLYGGIVASDFALYGLGMAARWVPWLNRFAIDARVVRVGEGLKHNLFGLVALCRVVPGVVFVAFVACGWARVPFWRFTAASLIVSALYLPLMLYLVIAFGDALDDHAGLWAWPMLLLLLGATSFARKRIFAFADAAADTADSPLPLSNFGMPPLSRADRKVAAAERIPPPLFYLPLVLNWIRLGFIHRCLTLPTAANPAIVTGGMWGETKSSYFRNLAPGQRRWIADFVVVERHGASVEADVEAALLRLDDAGLTFPLIAKPDVGWHGHGVHCIGDRDALARYLAQFPIAAPLMLQRYVPYAGEAAVLYARLPGEDKGRVLSLTFRYFPHVVGDGCATLRTLIGRDPRAQWKSALHLGSDPSHRGVDPCELERVPERGEVVRIALIGNQRAGALYRDGRHYLTTALQERFDAIVGGMHEFHYGRFDLRFENVETLMRGEGFSVVEINGIGGEAIDCWDPHLSVAEVYRRLAAHQRLLFAIGAGNRARGFVPTRPSEFVASLIRQGQLIRRYPTST